MLANHSYYAIGLMSGSSLDGLDICYVDFFVKDDNFNTKNHALSSSSQPKISYKILHADCVVYPTEMQEQIRNAPNLSAFDFAQLHTNLGRYFGVLTNKFMQINSISKIDFICSHGQTIFHQPQLGFTTQIGCGAQIAAQTSCKVICDLRTMDVAYNGQGAPIVPIAEQFLFPQYAAFLNIGGIANISLHTSKNIIAYDVCAGNTVLNYLANICGFNFDKDGELAKKGSVNSSLLEALNSLEFCKQAAPKSLGSEHVYADWITLLNSYSIPTEDKLATAVEHIAQQVGLALNNFETAANKQLLVTGGGAFNTYLISRIRQHTLFNVIVPDALTIQYKEALAMAFIGLLRLNEMPNTLSSVTGATKSTIGGAIYIP